MPIRPIVAALALALTAPILAAPADGPTRLFTGADLFNLEAAADPQISPDGRTVVYVRRANDIMSDRTRSTIWAIDVASGTQTPLVTGPGGQGQPRWSPDGSKLAYVASSDDKGGAQLYVRWMRSGATARITGLPAAPHAIAWSPDGRRLAYAMFVPDQPARLGKAPDKPEGANWAEPLQVIDSVIYRTDMTEGMEESWGMLYDDRLAGKIGMSSDPETVVEVAALVLGHRNLSTTEAHYQQAQSLSAHRQFTEVVGRRRAPKR